MLPFFLSGFLLSPKASQWSYYEITKKGTPTALLQFEPRCEDTGIKIEFLKTPRGMNAYLSVPSSFKFQEKLPVIIQTQETTLKTVAYSLEEGKKMLLDREGVAFIIHQLQQDTPIILSVEGCKSTLLPSCFCKYIHYMKKI